TSSAAPGRTSGERRDWPRSDAIRRYHRREGGTTGGRPTTRSRRRRRPPSANLLRAILGIGIEGGEIDELARDGEIAIVHFDVAGQPVLVELERDAVFRRLLAGFGALLVEIGDV